jgi:ATP-dependent helicase/nuclease subunit A
MSRLPDQADRDAIRRDLDANLLVEASAGTGKTHELISRMVNVIAEGEVSVRQMAAVTFTRKATAELRQRFQMALEIAIAAASDGVRRNRLEMALAGIDTCFIGTIHSFCAELLRERPVEAGLAPGFREVPDDDPELQDLRDRVWREQLELLENDDPEARLSDLLDLGIEPGDLKSCYETLCEFPDVNFPFDPAGEAGPPAAAVRAAAAGAVKFLDEALATLDGQRSVKTCRESLEQVRRSFEAADLDDSPSAAEALGVFEKRIKGPCEAPRRPTLGQQRMDEARFFRDEVVRPALLRWREFVYPKVMALATRAEREFRARRRRRALVSFTDLLLLARDLLREHPEARKELALRFSRILVDEFQDTDPLQAEVLLYLTGKDVAEKDWRKLRPRPGSLFVVGDPKQAIYRFRRADLAAYSEFKQIFRNAGRQVRLSTSFRSVPGVCDFINRSFESVFTGEGDEMQAGAARLEPFRGAGGSGAGVYRLAVQTSGSEQAGAAAARHAEAAADFVASELAARRPSDFLFLAPKRHRLSVYQRALERRGIPALVLSGTEKSPPEGVASGLLAFAGLLEAAAAPADPVPVVAFLRSGLCGASDEALLKFRDAGGRFDAFSIPPPNADERIASGLSLLRNCIEEAEDLPPAAAVSRLAERSGLFASAAAEEDQESAVATAARVLTFARRLSSEGWSFRDLAEELASVIREAKVSATSLSSGGEAVRLMTIHSAKGLEASVVLLVDPGDDDEPDEPQEHIERAATPRGFLEVVQLRGRGERPQRTLLAQPSGWEAMAERERRASESEIARRRYVAATRAKDLLIVGINLHSTQEEPLPKARGQWAPFEPYLETDLPAFAPQTMEKSRAVSDLALRLRSAREEIGRRSEALRRETYRLEAVTHRLRKAAEPAIVESTGGGKGAAFGRVMHRLLEAMMRREDLDLPALAEFLVEAEEVPPGEVEEVLRLVGTVRSSELWRRARSADECLVEVPFVVSNVENATPGLLRGAVDLVFREGNRWSIVDYKTDRATPGRLDALVDRYRAQVESYRREWEKFSGQPTSAGLYFLGSAEVRWVV